ncbi:MAG: FtsW/RodA/SpoVE family cell cycle protein, partial [bacterium]|nr:FtsW/RodA/SpoVE family cell cycle protein [bacterium]
VMILLGTWFGIVLISGMRLKQFVALLAIFAMLFTVAWFFLFAEYQQRRIISYVSRGYDPQGAGYNVRQARIAIGNGGFLGNGIARGSQVQLYFLPEAETDFVFAAAGEYFGLVGLFGILGSIGYILFWCFRVARRAQNNFSRLIAMGFFFLLLTQSSIHIGMNLGLFPVTGVPLPFVSYGGSNMLGMFMGLGLVASIAAQSAGGYGEDRELTGPV